MPVDRGFADTGATRDGFSGEFQNLRSDAFIWKTNQPGPRANRPVAFHDLLGLHRIKHFAAVFGDRCARVRHVGHELFHVMDDDLSDQILCHSFYVSSQEELVLCGGRRKMSSLYAPSEDRTVVCVPIASQDRPTAFDKNCTKGAVARSLRSTRPRKSSPITSLSVSEVLMAKS